jgi:hypothetical protein
MPATRELQPKARTLSPDNQAKALATILREEFGVPFRFYDAETGAAVAHAEPVDASALPPVLERSKVTDSAAAEATSVALLADGRYHLLLPFRPSGGPALIASGAILALARTQADAAQEQQRLQKWLQSVHGRLRGSDRSLGRSRPEPAPEGASALPWEAMLGLEHLLRGHRIHRDPAGNRRRILRVVADLVKASAVVWVPIQTDEDVLIEGELLLSPWDSGQLASLVAHSPDWQKDGFLIVNQVQTLSWSARFPQVVSLMAIPARDKDVSGWVIAFNKHEPTAASARSAQGDPPPAERANASVHTSPAPFRRLDVALVSPYVAMLAMTRREHHRYQSLKDLLVGLTRSLTAAIDAKDSYTFGHSERVARIAVLLAKQLGLQAEELSDLYLTGLLHDIGKIGIRDAVLGKHEPLTPEEFAHIKEHVTIGYKILAELKAIGHLLPGVLYHHERYDGTGYPEGLKGEMIPLFARILAVADSYDAMSTSRPYRSALPCHIVEKRLAEGAGTQWDARVIDAFLSMRDQIHAIRQRGVGESLRNALDGAMRDQDSVNSLPSQPPAAPAGH